MGKKRADNTSGFLGVSFNKGRWQAAIVRQGKYLWSARFDTAEEADRARKEALIRLGVPEKSMVGRATPAPPPVAGARWIPLTKGKFALVDEEDYSIAASRNWYFINGYAKMRNLDTGEITSLQAFLMRPDPGFEVDHADRDGLNCRRGNLRIATHAQNSQNCARKKHNRSGFIGVSFDQRTKRWAARGGVNGKHVFLGRFGSAEEAARARDAWVKIHHGPFASLNFPEQPADPKIPESAGGAH
jgi:hypothetical protein